MGQAEIQQGYEQFLARIRPAKLVQTGSNGNILGEALLQRGYNRDTMTADEIEQALFKVASLDSVIYRLQWEVEPAKVLKLRNEGKQTLKGDVLQGQKDFEVNKAKGDKQAAYDAAQAEAERAIKQLIESFVPVKNGRVNYSLQTTVQEHLTKHVAAEKARNADMKGVHKAVTTYIREQYRKAEG